MAVSCFNGIERKFPKDFLNTLLMVLYSPDSGCLARSIQARGNYSQTLVVYYMGGLCITWEDCVLHGRIVYNMGGLCITLEDCVC